MTTYTSAALAALASSAAAEGAHLRLDCTVTTACSEAGVCQPGDGPARYDIAPEAIDGEGAGSYRIATDASEPVPAQGLSRTGPFLWSTGSGTRAILTLTGEATALLVRQVTESGTGAPPSAEIDMMNCEVAY